MLTVVRQRTSLTITAFLFLVCALSDAVAGTFDKMPPLLKYQEGVAVHHPGSYDDINNPCINIGSEYNAWVAANPSLPPWQQVKWLNARGGYHPQWAWGCYFDILHLVDNPPDYRAGDVESNRFFQNYVRPYYACPDGYQLQEQYDATPAYYACVVVPAAKKYWRECDCPTAGDPVLVNVGLEAFTELDYPNQSSGVAYERYYRSSPDTTALWQLNLGRLGYSWTDSYRHSVVVRNGNAVMPSVATVFRPKGHAALFALTQGSWVPDADIADRLERIIDGSGNPAGWKFTNASDDSVETYDTAGKLLTIRSRAGVLQTLTYSTASTPATVAPGPGLLIRVVDSFGRALSFTYDGQMRVSTVTDPNGGVVAYAYDSNSNLASVTYPDGKSRSYVYNEQAHTSNMSRPAALTGVIDENNSRFATIKYDSSGRVFRTEHANAVERTTFTYSGTTTTVTDALGTARTYGFQTIFGGTRSTGVSQPCSGPGCGSSLTRAVSYDGNANVASRTDFNGAITNYSYDLTRNLETSRTEAYGTPRTRTITTQWHPTHRLPTQIDEPGRRTTLTRDANGNVLTKTILDISASASRTWIYTYNSFGRVLTLDGPRTDVSDVTTYMYYNCSTGYECGQVHTITNAAGHVTTYSSYNAHGQPLTITDANGVVTTLTYDARQRLKSRTVGSEVTTFDYWPTGLLKKATLPDGSYLEYTYDAAHRLTDVNDADGNRIHYTLDLMGNRTKEESYDPSNDLAGKRVRVFDALNRLQNDIGAAETAAVTTTYGYDNNGNQTSIAAPLGRDTIQAYDELNRLKQVTDPLNGNTHYGYNALDQLIAVTDPRGLVTSYQYSALGDLKQQTSPDTGVTTNTYDSGGNLKTSADARNVVTTYTYDELNRVTTATFAVGSTADQILTYSYDAGLYGKGRLTGVSDADHSLAWTYDEQGRVLTATQTVGSVSKTTSYSYLNGLRQSMTTPSGQVITYGYTNGKITSISVNGTVLVTNVLYEPFGPVRQWTWGNGSLSVRTFDDDGKITQIDSAGLKTYSYDDAFRITGITDTTDPSLSWTYGYDDLDRLTSAVKTGTSLGYTYDENGNRLTQTGSGASTFTIAPNSNRLTSTSGALTRTYGYDNAGNMTSFDGIMFAYNNRGRMKSSTRNGVTTNYTYNALGQLIKKGTSALYYYDDAGQALGIFDGSGLLTEEIVWLGDIPLATLRSKANGGVDVYYIHSDHLNAPRQISEASSGNSRWKWPAEPFGVEIPNVDPSGIGPFEFSLRFPGQIQLTETGLHYNYFRDYDPQTGRYVESDPIGLKGGVNTYAYVFSAPTRYVDPRGLQVYVGCAGNNGLTVCDGKDGFEIRNCNNTCTRPCTQQHEEVHVAEFRARHPDRCKNRARGTSPSLEEDFSGDHFFYVSECKAHRVGGKCADRIKASGCCRPEVVDEYIQNNERMKKYYRCVYKD